MDSIGEEGTYEGLAPRVDVGTVEGVAADDVYIAGEVLLECFDLWGFARGLASDDGILFGSCRVISQGAAWRQHHGIHGPYSATTLPIEAASTL